MCLARQKIISTVHSFESDLFVFPVVVCNAQPVSTHLPWLFYRQSSDASCVSIYTLSDLCSSLYFDFVWIHWKASTAKLGCREGRESRAFVSSCIICIHVQADVHKIFNHYLSNFLRYPTSAKRCGWIFRPDHSPSDDMEWSLSFIFRWILKILQILLASGELRSSKRPPLPHPPFFTCIFE